MNVEVRTQIQTWLQEQLSDYLNISTEGVQLNQSFQRYGLDSATSLTLAGDLSDWLGVEIEATLPYDYPTINKLAQYIADEILTQ